MHMLPEGTTTIGFGLFKVNVAPNHKPKNISTIKPMIVAVWMYSFFQSFLSFAVNELAPIVLLWLRVLYFKTYRFEKKEKEEY